MMIKPYPFRLFLAAATSLALGGCMLGPNFKSPDAPTSASYAMTGDAPPTADVALGLTTTAGPWWRGLGSADLDRTMALALKDNPTLEQADANLAQARAAVQAAKGGLYPEIDANAGVQRERLNFSSFGFSNFPGVPNNPEFTLYSAGLTASYAIPSTGGVRRQIESAAARAEAQRHQGDAATLSLTGQVALAAADIAAIRAEIETEEAIQVDDGKTLDLARRAEAVGGEPQGRRVSAQAQLANDAARLPPLRQDLAAARHRLALLVGHAPTDWTPPDFNLADLKSPASVPVSLPSTLVRRRPDILAAEAELHAATADIGVATARLYPNITLTGALTQSNLQPAQLFTLPGLAYDVGLGLTQPIFDGGKLRAERRETVAARRAAAATYQLTVIRAFGQVADLLQALAHDDESIAAETRAANSAAASLALARAGYGEGGFGLLPVVDAERTSNMARRALVEVQAQRLTDVIQLYIAAAADWTIKTPSATP